MNDIKTKPKMRLSVYSTARIAVCAALLCVLSPLAIPLPILVPITLQVFAVILVALVLDPLEALIAQALYTLLGCVGLPVFSGGKGGFGAVLSPTGGFIVGFILASFLVSLLKGSGKGRRGVVRTAAVAVLVGVPAVYIPGIVGFIMYTGKDILTAAVTLTSTFILIDVAKCLAAAAISIPINAALAKLGKDGAIALYVGETMKQDKPIFDTTHPAKTGAKRFAELFIADVKSRHFTVPDRAVADVALRRLGALKVKRGDSFSWTYGGKTGSAIVGADGLLTVPRLEIMKKPQTLKVSALRTVALTGG